MRITPNFLAFSSLRSQPLRLSCALALLAMAGVVAAPKVEAAAQTWTNAPVSGVWTNVLNWVGKTVPGDINATSANTVNGDIAIFNAPIPLSGIGGAGSPIIPDDATLTNGRSRRIAGITFDTTNCGAYVIWSPSATNFTDGSTTFTTGYLYVSQTNFVRMNDSVTNTEKVLVPMQVNLPSSTGGIFTLINNSTNPTAALIVNSVTHAGATSRGTTFVLDGTNTAVNVVTNLSEGLSAATSTSNAGGITKQGPNTWLLAGGGTFLSLSVINVTMGTLIVQDPGAFGSASMANFVVTNSVLQIDNVTLNNSGITVRNGAVIRMNGSGTVNGITATATYPGNTATLATTSASDVLTIGNGANTLTGGAGDTLLHIAGPGTVLLSQSANYAGKWTVDSGTNQIGTQGALGTGGNLNVNAGAVFDATPVGTGTTYSLDTKAFSANGTGMAVGSTASTVMADSTSTIDFVSRPMTLTFTPVSTNGDSGHPALYCPRGTMAFHGNTITVVNASGLPLGAGTYQIARQAVGNISSSGAFVTLVTGSQLAPGMIGEITASAGNLNLIVSAYTPKSLLWTGNDPLISATWDRQTSTNWLAGATPSIFNIYDTVVFNATGVANPNVNIASTMVPGNVTVDTSAGNYTFSGSGQVAGGAGLTKMGAGTLTLQTANTYSGGTTISNGVIKLATDEGVGSTGATNNDLVIFPGATFDLNGYGNTVNGLIGGGAVDVTGGGSSVLTIGYNGDSGTFTGVVQNTSGSMSITKTGSGTEILTRSNSFVGTTDLELGTLRVTDTNGLGTSAVVINGGTLDLVTNLWIASLSGNGGAISALTTTTTNTLTVWSNSTTVNSFAGSIGGGKIALQLLGGVLRMTAANTYSNGTYVGSGATFQIHNTPASVTGALIASNNATLGLSGGGSSPAGTPTSITTVDGGTVTFTSAAEGDVWGGQFLGTAATTNIYTGPVSPGGAMSFSNFLGLVRINLTTSSQNFRFFNSGGISGGDNTTFEFDSGNVHTRDAQSVSLGAVLGGTSSTSGIGGNGTGGTVSTWIIGAKNTDNFFEGYISGSNNLVKAGSGVLVLDGASVTTNTDSSSYTNYSYASVISYLNNTTISNGVLTLVVPNDLANSPTITLANTNAILDATRMGYLNTITDGGGNTDYIPVTNGMLTILATTAAGAYQSLNGIGFIKGAGVTNNGTINPGLSGLGGTLFISNSLAVNAGATNWFDLSDDPSGLVTPSDLLKVQNNINLSGSSVISLGEVRGTINAGKYTLIKYGGHLVNESGNVGLGPVANLSLAGPIPTTSRATLVLSNAPAAGELDLVVVGLNNTNLVWQGDSVSNWWDIVNSANWTNTLGAHMQYYQFDNLTFDNSTTNLTVTLLGSMSPTTLTVNSSSNYIFGGSGNIIGDVTLTKAGTGNLLLTNGANSYSGGTVINGGILKVGAESGGNENDLALGSGPVTVNAGTELRFGGNTGSIVNHYITNTIVVNGGTVTAADGAQHLTNSTVTVNAAGVTFFTVYSTKNVFLESSLLGTGPLTNSVGTNVSAGQLVLVNSNNPFSGPVTILTNANVGLAGYGGLSNAASIDLRQGGFLDISARTNSSWSLLSPQTLQAGGTIRGKFITFASGSSLSVGLPSAIGTLIVTNNASTNYAMVTYAGAVALDINRASSPNCDRILTLNGTNAFGGTLTVNNLGAALVAGDTFQLFTSATNTGAFAATLPTLSSGLVWSNSITLNGKITVVAAVIVPSIPPGITNFSLVGGNVVISGTNGQSGATYYLLSTTNVATPRAQWKTVATNVFGAANFSFIGTNSVTAGSGQQFYMLSSTNYNP